LVIVKRVQAGHQLSAAFSQLPIGRSVSQTPWPKALLDQLERRERNDRPRRSRATSTRAIRAAGERPFAAEARQSSLRRCRHPSRLQPDEGPATTHRPRTPPSGRHGSSREATHIGTRNNDCVSVNGIVGTVSNGRDPVGNTRKSSSRDTDRLLPRHRSSFGRTRCSVRMADHQITTIAR
jgi:hypothetical protein